MKKNKYEIFFVLMHGNHGHPNDFNVFEEELGLTFGDKAIFLKSKSNSENTHVGVVKGGQNLSNEILDFFKEKIYNEENNNGKKVKFVMIAHSLGGLFARSSLKYLFQEENKTFIENIEPFIFMTLATPHLGSQRPGGKIHKSIWKGLTHLYVNKFLEKTGEDLILKSNVLLEMSEKEEYTLPLKKFKYRTCIGNIHYDLSVPFPSACVTVTNPYAPPPKVSKKPKIFIVGHYGFGEEHIGEESIPSSSKILDTINNEEYAEVDNYKHCKVDLKMLNNCRKLFNRRIDVRYEFKVHQLNNAHDGLICKKCPVGWSNELEEISGSFVKKIVKTIELDYKLID